MNVTAHQVNTDSGLGAEAKALLDSLFGHFLKERVAALPAGTSREALEQLLPSMSDQAMNDTVSSLERVKRFLREGTNMDQAFELVKARWGAN